MASGVHARMLAAPAPTPARDARSSRTGGPSTTCPLQPRAAGDQLRGRPPPVLQRACHHGCPYPINMPPGRRETPRACAASTPRPWQASPGAAQPRQMAASLVGNRRAIRRHTPSYNLYRESTIRAFRPATAAVLVPNLGMATARERCHGGTTHASLPATRRQRTTYIVCLGTGPKTWSSAGGTPSWPGAAPARSPARLSLKSWNAGFSTSRPPASRSGRRIPLCPLRRFRPRWSRGVRACRPLEIGDHRGPTTVVALPHPDWGRHSPSGRRWPRTRPPGVDLRWSWRRSSQSICGQSGGRVGGVTWGGVGVDLQSRCAVSGQARRSSKAPAADRLGMRRIGPGRWPCPPPASSSSAAAPRAAALTPAEGPNSTLAESPATGALGGSRRAEEGVRYYPRAKSTTPPHSVEPETALVKPTPHLIEASPSLLEPAPILVQPISSGPHSRPGPPIPTPTPSTYKRALKPRRNAAKAFALSPSGRGRASAPSKGSSARRAGS